MAATRGAAASATSSRAAVGEWWASRRAWPWTVSQTRCWSERFVARVRTELTTERVLAARSDDGDSRGERDTGWTAPHRPASTQETGMTVGVRGGHSTDTLSVRFCLTPRTV